MTNIYQNHCTTHELKIVSGCTFATLNTVINKALAGLPDNPHPIKRGRPRVVSRSEAGRILVGAQLYEGGGTTLDMIRPIVRHPAFDRIMDGRARLLVRESSGALSTFEEIDDELLAAMRAQRSWPTTMLDLRPIREMVDAAIEYCETHRWGFDHSKLGDLAKTQAEIKAARDEAFARQKAGV
jgi:hypothetical protein